MPSITCLVTLNNAMLWLVGRDFRCGEPVGRWPVLLADNGKQGADRWLTKATRTTAASLSGAERCWAVLGGAELSGHRPSAPAVAEPVGQLRGFFSRPNFGAGVPLGAGVAVHAGTVAATMLNPGIVSRPSPGGCGVATPCGGRSAAWWTAAPARRRRRARWRGCGAGLQRRRCGRPGVPACRDCGDHRSGLSIHPRPGDIDAAPHLLVRQAVGQHCSEVVFTAQACHRFGMPLLALLVL